jgi:hypothetical protein
MATCPFPIAILSFNRPDLLTEVLKSLKSQTIGADGARIYLFQDGAQSRFTQEPADDFLQNECVKCFRDIFPDGQVLQSPVNLGIALNFDRAERLFFEDLQAECGLFFEDDLLLSPHYLDALLQLAHFALAEPLVAYVAAYGDHTAPLERQRAASAKIIRMGHKWGFALTRRQWFRQREIVDGYLSIVRENEYSRRDHKRVETYFASLGFVWAASSQDAAKDLASFVLGTTSLMCFPCFARYIGKEGLHFTTDFFNKHGYEKTELFDGPPPQFEFPSRAQLARQASDERAFSSRQPVALVKDPDVNDVTVQTSAVEFVESLYVTLLNRTADQQGLVAWTNAIRNGKSLSDVVRSFVESREYESKLAARAKSSGENIALDTTNKLLSDSNKYIYFGNLLPQEAQYKSDLFIGLALTKMYDKNIVHDATTSLPFADNSIIGFQSQDVFEHIGYEKIRDILDDIFRCLRPGGIFRLSLPDYNSPLLKSRSLYDCEGNVLCDAAMGGSVKASMNGGLDVNFAQGGNSHLWFPTYRKVLHVIVSSRIRKCSSISIHQAWIDSKTYVCRDFDQTIMPVVRTPPRDMRANGKPISIVIDFIK